MKGKMKVSQNHSTVNHDRSPSLGAPEDANGGGVPAGGFGGLVSAGLFAGLLTGLLAAIAGSGCADRTYLTKSHGRAYAEAFDRQTVPAKARPKNGGADVTEGLDSQEASVVARSYRKSLAGKEGATDQAGQNTVITNSGAVPQAPYMPPPSVPSGQ